MHIPDGFIGAGTSLGAAAVASGGLTVAIRRAGAELSDRQVPLAGLTAAFLFAMQMLNFPVAAGTSGHLIGGVLAAVLVGPWTGAVAVATVVVVQSLFADGGVTALGLNVLNLALVASLGGYVVFLGLRKVLPPNRSSIVIASGVAAGLSVLGAAAAFSFEYALGGNAGAPAGTVTVAMLGVHALIGIGEGLITAATVSSVIAVRPDLVRGAAPLSEGVRVPSRTGPRHRMKERSPLPLVLASLAVLGLIIFLSPQASNSPDGLQRVARDLGIDATERDHALDDAPLARYSVDGVEDRYLSRRLAGGFGVVLMFVAAAGLLSVIGRVGSREDPS